MIGGLLWKDITCCHGMNLKYHWLPLIQSLAESQAVGVPCTDIPHLESGTLCSAVLWLWPSLPLCTAHFIYFAISPSSCTIRRDDISIPHHMQPMPSWIAHVAIHGSIPGHPCTVLSGASHFTTWIPHFWHSMAAQLRIPPHTLVQSLPSQVEAAPSGWSLKRIL